MSIKLQLPKLTDLKPRIVVIGVGGAGGNAINNMIVSGLAGVEYVAANTDAQALSASNAERRVQLGIRLTEGLGAGSKPEIGEAAAEEAIDDLKAQIQGAHMVFIAAGMGGGTGTGAAAVIARVARELDVLTVGIVTKPFAFEGTRRMRTAEAGIAELRKTVDTLIVIPNQNLFRIATEKTTFAEAFVRADQVLYAGIACIVDLIVKEGLINLDFADVRTVMTGMGTAMMGTGEASGEGRAKRAAEEAIANPLLDEVSLRGAKGVLLSIIGGHDLTLFEVDQAANRVREEVDGEANIIVGATFDESLGDRVRVAIVASGMTPSLGAAQTSGYARNVAPPPPQRPSPAGAAAADEATPARMPMPDHIARGLPPQTSRQPHAVPAQVPQNTHTPMPHGAARTPPATGDRTGREVWRAPGNVVIEASGLPAAIPGTPRTSPPPLDRATAPTTGGFKPAAPAELPLQSRRIPEPAEFPHIVQRELAVTPEDDPTRDGKAPAHDAGGTPKGLLQRVMNSGLGWRQSSPSEPAGRSEIAVTRAQTASESPHRLPVFFNGSKR